MNRPPCSTIARTHPHPRQLFIEPDALRAFTDAFGAAN
jgi:hypothetical protein